jgi:class 3 adenylate cyclase
MKFRPGNLLPLLLPFLLTALPLVILHIWEERSTEFRADSQRKAWYRESRQRFEEFSGYYAPHAQWQAFFRQVRLRVTRALNHHPPEDLTARLLMDSLKRSIPRTHRPPGTRIFGFTIDESGKGTPLLTEGFATTNSRIITRFFAEMLSIHQGGRGRLSSLNRRSTQLFGSLLTPETLLKVRGKGTIRAVFDRQPAEMYWQTLVKGKRIIGGVLVVLPVADDQTPFLRHALATKVWRRHPHFLPVLLPIHSARSVVSPVVPRRLEKNPTLQNFLDRVAHTPSVDTFLPPGEATGHLPGLDFFRSPIHLSLPYELWVLRPTSTSSPVPHSRQKEMQAFFLAGWLLFALKTMTADKPFSMRMSRWFSLYLLLVSGFPVVLAVLIGFSLIDLQASGKVEQRIADIRKTFADIDSSSSSRLSNFGALCSQMLEDDHIREMWLNKANSEVRSVLNQMSQRFREAGFPLEGIISFKLGEAQIFHPPEAEERLKDAFRGYYLPLLAGSMKHLDRQNAEDGLKKIAALDQLVLQVFQMIADGNLNDEITFLRQKAEAISVAGNKVYQYFDLLADRNRIVGALVFRAPAHDSNETFSRQMLRGMRAAQAGRKMVLGSRSPDGDIRLVYFGNVSARDRKPMRRFVRHMFSTRASGLTHLPDSRSLVGFLGYQMEHLVMAELVDFSAVHFGAATDKRRLTVVALAVLGLVIALGISFSGWFFQPLARMEKALRRILNRDLDVRIGLERDDELGDVATAFDSMTKGLQERYEIGRFVSGTLDAAVSAGENTDTEPRIRLGVILASDIRSFTTLSETYPVEQIVTMLNRHLDLMSQEIEAQGGKIDEFIGDAIVAVFFDDNPAIGVRRAITAAQGMMRTHRDLNQQREHEGLFGYGMGVGVAVGDLLVGTFGSAGRMKFALMGEPRHQAELVEAASKAGKFTRIILHPSAAELAPDVPLQVLPDGSGAEVIPWN